MPLKKKKQRRKVLTNDDVAFLTKLKEHSYTWYPFEYHQNYFEVLQDLIDTWPKKSFTKTQTGKDFVEFGYVVGFLTCQKFHMEVDDKRQIIDEFLTSTKDEMVKLREKYKLKALEPNFDY